MILKIRDYESITLNIDETEYYLTKHNINTVINRIDGEDINIVIDGKYKKVKTLEFN